MSEKKITLNWQGQVYDEVIEGKLALSNLTPEMVREAIGRAVGMHAFYGGIRADAKKLEAQKKAEYDKWKAQKYMAIDEAEPKKTETWKNNQIILDYPEEWDKWQKKLRDLDHIVRKSGILLDAFKLQAQTLQTVGSMMKSEFEIAHLSGAGLAGGKKDLTD